MVAGPGPVSLPDPGPADPPKGGVWPPARARLADIGLIAGLVVAGLALGWSVLSIAMADRLAKSAPDAALVWRERHAGALVAQAERRLATGDLAAAEALARAALTADPLEIPATRVLGLVADRRGEERLAERLMDSAGARSNRDPGVQMWLVARAWAKGDYDRAFARADALLRDEPDLARRMYPVLAEIAGQPGAIPPLAARLATRPPWRAAFIQTWIRETAVVDGPVALLERLEATSARPTDGEWQALENRLIRDRRFQQAFVYWVQRLPAAQLRSLTDVNDGGFQGGWPEGRFTWTIERPGLAVAEFATPPGREDRALHLGLFGSPAPQVIVRQLLVLPPGRRVLTGEVRAERLEAVEGLAWTLRCVGDGNLLIGETPTITAATTGWRQFAVAFETPATGCEAQWLTLGAVGRTAGARRMSGEVWYDNIRVSR